MAKRERRQPTRFTTAPTATITLSTTMSGMREPRRQHRHTAHRPITLTYPRRSPSSDSPPSLITSGTGTEFCVCETVEHLSAMQAWRSPKLAASKGTFCLSFVFCTYRRGISFRGALEIKEIRGGKWSILYQATSLWNGPRV
jgi:hypothetical protein